MPAVNHANDFRWNAKIHAGKKPLLVGGWGGGGGRGDIKLAVIYT